VPVVVGLFGVGSTDLVSRLGHSFRVQRLLRGRIPEVGDVVAGVILSCMVVSIIVARVTMPVVVFTVVEGMAVPVVVSTVVARVTMPVVVSTVVALTEFEVLLACLQYSNPSLGRFRGVGVVPAENITEDIDEVDVPVEAAVVEVFFEVEVFVEVVEVVLVEVSEVVLVEVSEVVLVEVAEDALEAGASKSTL
jgi:hypothetical protein